MSTFLSEFYRVHDDDREVKLGITIGHAQPGTTNVTLDTEPLRSTSGDPQKFECAVGTGKEANGKTLYCASTLRDQRTETNKTSVRYSLTGGPEPFEQTLEKTVQNDGEVVFYTATIEFYV
jgi:hypothetical protein